MRKLKLFFACLLMAVLSIGQVWATSPATLSFTAKCNGSGIDTDGNSWTISSDGTESNFDDTKGIHYGTSSGQVKYIRLSTSGFSGTITQVTVNASTASGVSATVAVKVGSTDFTRGTPASTTASLTSNAAEYTFTGSASGEILVEITKPSKATKAIYCKSVVVTYTTSSVVAVESIELDEDNIILNEDATQTLQVTVNPSNATNKNVTWESDDEDVATVEDGVVTAVGAGDAVITCKSVADNTKSATCNVHVNSPYTKSKLIFTAACGGSGTANDGAEWTVTSDGTESVYDGTSGIHYGTGSANVTYVQLATSDITGEVAKVVVNARDAQATATISVIVGGTAFTCASATATNTSADYVFTGTGSGEIVVRVDRGSSMSKAIYVKSVVVSYTPAAVEVKKPTFSVIAGSYLEAQSVELSCATTGADIYYTLNGEDPDENSTHYEGTAIQVSTTTTIKAIAIKDEVSSPIASATYTIVAIEHAGTSEDPYSVADAKAVIDGIGTKAEAYVSGKISQVDSYDSNHNSITYWISADGKTSGQQLQVYSGKGIEGADFSSIDDVVAKATVVVKGTLKKYNDVYEFDYNNQLVSYVPPVEPTVTLKQSGSTVTSLNLDATGVATQAIDIVCGNFADAISSVSAKLYEESTCETEITSGAWVTDITVNGAKDQVTFNVADNESEARQVWMKVTASDGTNEAYAVLAISQAKYTVDYAELPFEFDGGRADIASTNGMSQEGLGSDYSASPKLKFDGTGDLLIIKINEEPGLLTYCIKNNSFSGGTFTVQESKDGTSYTEVASHTEITNTQNEEYNLDKDTRFVKFIYTEKVNGNVGLGNIAISEYVAPAVKPTITTQPEGAEYAQDDPAEALTIVAEAAIGGNLSYQWYSNDENTTEGAVAIEGADEAEYTPSTASIATTYYYCVVTEEGADEPTISNIVAVVVSESTPATVTFELFSGELVEGDYVLVFATRNNAMKASQTLNVNRLDYDVVNPSDNKLVNPDAALVWHIAPISETDYWTIYSAEAGKYAASTNAKNQATLADGDLTDNMKWAVTVSAGKYDFENIARSSGSDPNNKWLRNNDDGTNHYGFACYASGTGTALTLYKKKIEGQPAKPTFTVAGGTYTSAQSVGINCETEDVAIYYTTDGTTTPTSESTPYTGAISVSETMTIKAIAIKNEIASDVASATYTIVAIEHEGTEADPYTVADAHNAILVGGDLSEKYVSGIISQIDSYSSQYHSITYWISDDGTTANQLQVYSGKGIDGANFNSVNDLAVNDIVVVKGTLKDYESVHEFDKNNQLVSITKPSVPTVTLKQSGSAIAELNVEAASVANQAIDVECTHFAVAISSLEVKLYEESICENEITSGAWVTDITVNGAKDQVTFNVADNDGDARQVWMKVTASDGTDEVSAVLAISQAKPEYATLPFTFDGGKADIANKAGMSHSGLGSDYTASPKLKFDGTGDYLIIRINEAPGKLTYDIKGNGFEGSTFTVQQSVDGEAYNDLETYTELGDKQSEVKTLAPETRYVKFIYTEKVQNGGNVALGNITIAPQYELVRGGLTSGNYYTVCYNKTMTEIKGATLWSFAGKDANMAYLIQAEAPFIAGTPYFIYAESDKLEAKVEEVANPQAGNNNGLYGTLAEMSNTALLDAGADYLLQYNELHPIGNGYLKAQRAYVKSSEIPGGTPNAPGKRVRAIPMHENVVTGMENVQGDDVQCTKVLINGQLFILRGEKMYDVKGQLVK